MKLTEDEQIQVRKIAQSSLLVLMERDLVDYTLLNEWICPHIAQQATSMNVTTERRTEAVNMMCRMAPLVGHEIAVSCFLDAFVKLSSDSDFSIRKACALCYGQFCRVIGEQAVENILLCKFVELCVDSQWGVRKACADTFVDVSAVLLLEKRKPLLPDLYIGLLCDQSRWVKFSAYQNLGRFIATFADPSKTGLQYNPDGTWTCFDLTGSQSFVSLSEIEDDEYYEPPMLDYPSTQSEKEFDCVSAGELSSECIKTVNLMEVARDALSKLTVKHGQEQSDNDKPDFTAASTFCEINDDIGKNELVHSSSKTSIEHEPILCPVESRTNICDDSTAVKETEKSSQSPTVFVQRTKSHSVASSSGEDFLSSVDERSRKSSLSENPFTVTAKDGHVHFHLDNDSFNHYQFWRTPLPEVELDVDIEEGKATSIHVRAKTLDERDNVCSSDFSIEISAPVVHQDSHESQIEGKLKNQTSKLNTTRQHSNTKLVKKNIVLSSHEMRIHLQSSFDEANWTVEEGELSTDLRQLRSSVSNDSTNVLNQFEETIQLDSLASDSSYEQSPYDQDIVPPELLEKFIEMVEPSLSLTLDSDITRYCAYCLPAVTYTVGRQNWACLRKMCQLLASDMQWKVRKTMACCLHELATVLGSDISTKDLFPLFLTLLNDLDEVRMGLLQNLYKFLKHVWPRDRRRFLPYIENCMKMDNDRNWRFRCTLAEQLIPTVRLYCHADVEHYMIPVAMALIKDKVCDVRQAAVNLMAVIVGKMSQKEDKVLKLLEELNKKFVESDRWLWRQLYVMMCQRFAVQSSVSLEMYSQYISLNLLRLARDCVPNVRLAVARCLTDTLTPDHFKDSSYLLASIIAALQNDEDRDVRFYAQSCSILIQS